MDERVTSRAPRNAIDDLHAAFQYFFWRVKAKQKPGFPTFKKKGINDSFALREKNKFDVDDRSLRLEKAPGRIKMRQQLRFVGQPRSVTISLRAGKFYAAVLVETNDYTGQSGNDTVGVDLGIMTLATLSTGEAIPANQRLKANLSAAAAIYPASSAGPTGERKPSSLYRNCTSVSPTKGVRFCTSFPII